MRFTLALSALLLFSACDGDASDDAGPAAVDAGGADAGSSGDDAGVCLPAGGGRPGRCADAVLQCCPGLVCETIGGPTPDGDVYECLEP